MHNGESMCVSSHKLQHIGHGEKAQRRLLQSLWHTRAQDVHPVVSSLSQKCFSAVQSNDRAPGSVAACRGVVARAGVELCGVSPASVVQCACVVVKVAPSATARLVAAADPSKGGASNGASACVCVATRDSVESCRVSSVSTLLCVCVFVKVTRSATALSVAAAMDRP